MPLSTRLRRHPERAVDGPGGDAILAAGTVAHVGVVIDGEPLVIPMLYEVDGADVLLHGAPASRLLRHLAGGARACITVTLVDGLVASRSAMYHSANYRSVVLFGTGSPVTDRQRKRRVLERMTARMFAGRSAGRDYGDASDRELDATLMVAVGVAERSAKARAGGPLGPLDALPPAEGWTMGVVAPGPGGSVAPAPPG